MADSLIPENELTELKDASTVKDIADSAQDILEEQTCAHLINTAANTGAHFVFYQHDMSDKLKTTLESRGYEVVSNAKAADPSLQWIIRGF